MPSHRFLQRVIKCYSVAWRGVSTEPTSTLSGCLAGGRSLFDRSFMDKPFLSIDEQIALLELRGVKTDERTSSILLREGYYQIVNG